MITNMHNLEELKRQCEIRHLPYSEVQYLISELLSELEREIDKLYENEEARRRTYNPVDPTQHDHYWGNKMVDKYQEALSDVLKLFNHEK